MDLNDLINKEVPLRYAGADLFFDLSQGLFSSFEIDRGSRMLLKSLEPLLGEIQPEYRLLDTGCGTGVLGLSLTAALAKRGIPGTAVFTDRDALAVEFSRHNARKNELMEKPGLALEFSHELALENTEASDPFSLMVCNWPAKAGSPVLADFLSRTPRLLRPQGLVAVVIVNTLAEELKTAAEEREWQVAVKEKGSDHTVYHLTRGLAEATGDDPFSLEPYIRRRGAFFYQKRRYTLSTVYNLNNFDERNHLIDLTVETAQQELTPGKTLFWQPGQGHLPQILTPKITGDENLILASRDRLQLLTTRENLDYPVTLIGAPRLTALTSTSANPDHPAPGSLQNLITPVETGPSGHNPEEVLEAGRQLLLSGGSLLLYGKASALAGISKKHPGFTRGREKKRHGQRVLHLIRR